MKNLLLLIILFQVSFSGNSQSSVPFIEIAVDETVELKMKSATFQVTVKSRDRQLDDNFFSYDYYWEEEYYYEDEEDYYYEQMLEESPKKVTKEMKKAYEKRQEEREQREIERELEVAEQDAEKEKFVAYTTADLIKVLKENRIKFTITSNHDRESVEEEHYEEEYYEYEYDYDDYRSDSIIEILLTSEDEMNAVRALVVDLSVRTNMANYVFESVEDHYETVLPILTEKAKKQATILAASMGKKIGKVLQCTNVYPYTPSSIALLGIYNGYQNDYDNWYGGESNPFEKGNEVRLEYVYRFAII